MEGFFLGAFAGFMGGIMSSKNNKAPVHDMYQFFATWSNSNEEQVNSIKQNTQSRMYDINGYYEDVDDYNYYRTWANKATQSYLQRKYLGFKNYNFIPSFFNSSYEEFRETNPDNTLIIKDLLDVKETKFVVKQFLSKCKTHYYRAEFTPIDDRRLLKTVVNNILDECAQHFLNILLKNGISKVDILSQIADLTPQKKRIVMEILDPPAPLKVLLYCSLNSNKESLAHKGFFNSPIYDKKVLALVNGFCSGNPNGIHLNGRAGPAQ